MAELKTRPTSASVKDFLSTVEPEEKQQDGFKLLEMFEEATGEKAVMWGPAIVGFGQYHYKSERSRQEGDWPLTGFSPRKQNLTLYVLDGRDEHPELFDKLGKHTTSKSCLYLKRLSDVDLDVLSKLIRRSFEYAKRTLT
jgi:hypothetical protein